jgi:hypothetical protein
MAYSALKLITNSYYLSQVVARELEIVIGQQTADGLDLLNALLNFKSTDLRLIPYFKRDSFPTINGVEEYYRPGLLQVDSMTFNIGTVRYPMREMARRDYFAGGRVDNITNLPWSYRQERELGGTRLYLYFLPGGEYTVKLSGKFSLQNVELMDDLSEFYDSYYIEYLRYELANYICAEYGATFPDQSAMKLQEMRKKLMDVNPPDLRVRGRSYFNSSPAIDWQFINLGVGYLPY